MPHSPEILAINPLGKVPAMRCGTVQLFESLAITTYIDRAYPGPKLFPDDPELCGRITQWVSAFNTTGDGASAVRGSGAAAALSYDGTKVARETYA